MKYRFAPEPQAGTPARGRPKAAERVEALGGAVVIDTAPGQGARIVITVPVPPEGARA